MRKKEDADFIGLIPDFNFTELASSFIFRVLDVCGDLICQL